MNKLTKVGFSALCGSLAVVSAANAGELTVTGGADLTYISKGGDVTGNPIGMGSNYTLNGSGELDNGWTYALAIQNANLNAFSAANFAMTMGGLGKITITQGDSTTGIKTVDDKMPTAWEETWGTGLGTGIRLPTGSGTSQSIMYSSPVILGTSLTLSMAPQYGVTDTGDKATAASDSANANSYDATININPSLGTEILSGLNLFAGASTIQSVKNNTGNVADRYEAVGGVTYSLGPIELGLQYSGDYTGQDNGSTGGAENTHTDETNFYKAYAFGIAFNVNDDLSLSYGEWQHQKAGGVSGSWTPLPKQDRTVVIESWQAAYTMGGASLRIANTKVDNANWGTTAWDDKKATTVSLGLAF
jgi:hypothetical protein